MPRPAAVPLRSSLVTGRLAQRSTTLRRPRRCAVIGTTGGSRVRLIARAERHGRAPPAVRHGRMLRSDSGMVGCCDVVSRASRWTGGANVLECAPSPRGSRASSSSSPCGRPCACLKPMAPQVARALSSSPCHGAKVPTPGAWLRLWERPYCATSPSATCSDALNVTVPEPTSVAQPLSAADPDAIARVCTAATSVRRCSGSSARRSCRPR